MTDQMSEQECRLLWLAEAKQQTIESLPSFLKKLSEYKHDYGTICVAIAMASIAAAHAMDKTESGGITGFQAGAIFWEFYNGWMGNSGPAKIINYDKLLYPQYSDMCNSISPDTWSWLRQKAKQLVETENLNEALSDGGHVHNDVYAHWVSIADGNVPFGLVVKD